MKIKWDVKRPIIRHIRNQNWLLHIQIAFILSPNFYSWYSKHPGVTIDSPVFPAFLIYSAHHPTNLLVLNLLWNQFPCTWKIRSSRPPWLHTEVWGQPGWYELDSHTSKTNEILNLILHLKNIYLMCTCVCLRGWRCVHYMHARACRG